MSESWHREAQRYLVVFEQDWIADQGTDDVFAADICIPVECAWFPKRMGSIRNTARASDPDDGHKCDGVMGLPTGKAVTSVGGLVEGVCRCVP